VARAQDIRPEQVWQDAAGRRLQVKSNAGPDGKYALKNVDTGRTLHRGPRALVNMVQDAPPGAGAPPGYPGQQPYHQPGPPPAWGAHEGDDDGVEEDGGDGDYEQPAYDHRAFGFAPPQQPPPAPSRRAPPPPARRAPPAPRRNAPPAGYGPPPAQLYPPPGYFGEQPAAPPAPPPAPAPAARAPRRANPVGGPPSELVRFLCERLTSLDPSRAGSPSVVSSEFARAMAEWKTTRSAF
jgi:hypothetical protein